MNAPRYQDDGTGRHLCVCGDHRGHHVATGDGRPLCRSDATRRGWRRWLWSWLWL